MENLPLMVLCMKKSIVHKKMNYEYYDRVDKFLSNEYFESVGVRDISL